MTKPYRALLLVQESKDQWRIQTYHPGLNEQDGNTILVIQGNGEPLMTKRNVIMAAKALSGSVSIKPLN